jgi:hypothetical protein
MLFIRAQFLRVRYDLNMNYTQEQIVEMSRLVATSAIETIAKFRNVTVGDVWDALNAGDDATIMEFATLVHRGVASVVHWSSEARKAGAPSLPAYLRTQGGL